MAAEQFFSGGKILAPHVAMLKLDQAGTEAVEIERSDDFSIKPLAIDLEQIEILEAVLDDERIEPQRWHVDTLKPILRNSTLPRHNRWIRRCDCQSILYFLTGQHLLTVDAIQTQHGFIWRYGNIFKDQIFAAASVVLHQASEDIGLGLHQDAVPEVTLDISA